MESIEGIVTSEWPKDKQGGMQLFWLTEAKGLQVIYRAVLEEMSP